MKIVRSRAAAFVMPLLVVATSGARGAEQAAAPPRIEVARGIEAGATPVVFRPGELSSRVLAIPPAAGAEKRRGAPVFPSFRSTVAASGRTYTFTMVGNSPFVRGAAPVTVTVPIIPLALHFADGTVLDPTRAGGCSGSISPVDAVLASPLFQNVDWGEGVGRQYIEETRRLEFWAYTGPGRLNPGYSVRLAPRVFQPVTVTVSAAAGQTQAATCGRTGKIDGAALLTFIRTQVMPQFPRVGVNATMFPVFLLLDTYVQFQSSTAAGFHTAVATGGQTFGVALFDSAQDNPTRRADVSVLSHEIAEWYDDPWVNNTTPPWGHTGQVTGCQANLEVGDPLSGTFVAPVTMGNGFTYHLQEVAFFSWFFHQVPSLGVGGVYSSNATFTAPAAACH